MNRTRDKGQPCQSHIHQVWLTNINYTYKSLYWLVVTLLIINKSQVEFDLLLEKKLEETDSYNTTPIEIFFFVYTLYTFWIVWIVFISGADYLSSNQILFVFFWKM